jgi:predicted membrane-bound spermidine synthase
MVVRRPDTSRATALAPAKVQAVARLLLFLSGATALAFQTLWVKQLTLVVGVEVLAVAVGVAAFFAGLAAGAAALGTRADRSHRPLRWYASLEALVAILGTATTLLMPSAPQAFVVLQSRVGWLAWLLPGLLVAIPAFFMGGTLPAATRWLQPMDRALGRDVGALYAWNTAGAILGALLAPFALVPWLGVRGAGLAAALACLATAAIAMVIERGGVGGGMTGAHDRPVAAAGSFAPRVILGLALYACAGGIAMGYEVLWSQIVAPFTSTRGAAFALVLAVYLSGLALGSGIWARVADRIVNRWAAFGFLIALSGLLAVLTYAGLGSWLPRGQDSLGAWVGRAFGSHAPGMYARFLFAATVIVLPATLALGAAFPAAVRLTGDAAAAGRSVGRVAAWNMVGAIAGTLLVGFVAVPQLGLARTLFLLAVMSCAIGAIAVMVSPSRNVLTAAVSAALLLASVAAAVQLPQDRLGTLLAQSRGGHLDFYREGAGGAVAVLTQQTPAGEFRRLYISGVSNSGDSLASLRYMRLQALLPLMIHSGEPRSAMVIALGTGITCGALLADPDLTRRSCVELLPEVVQATDRFHGNFGVAHDDRVDIRLADGRHELLRSAESWDLITLEPPPPSAAGVVNLYSREFYELARRRLAPGGMVAQWWPLPTQNLEDSRSLVRSFVDAFPYVSVWTTEVHEMLLVGSMEPVTLDTPRIAARFARPGVASALAEVGVGSTAALLATWVTDRKGLLAFVGDAPPVTDDRPRIEVAPWLRPGEMARVLPAIISVTTDPPLVAANADFRAQVDRHRGELGLLFQALQASLEGDRATTSGSLRRLRAADPTNPYYAWMAPAAIE